MRMVARTWVRRSPMAVTTACQAVARSKSAGRSTTSSVRATDRTRPTRKVRRPAVVLPTRYQTVPFDTRPSGSTGRSVTDWVRST